MLKAKKISDYVHDEILQNIVQLKYQPGEKISEAQLAKEMGVSRAPIKSALAKLESEGLVSIRPQNGTFVSNISVERARNICDIRILLETYAVRIVAERITDKELEEVQKLFDQMNAISDENAEKRQFIYETDAKLHDLIYRASGNAIIGEVIERYRPEIRRIQHANMTWVNRKEPTQAEMKKIFAALKVHNPDAAERAMREHLSNIKKAVETL